MRWQRFIYNLQRSMNSTLIVVFVNGNKAERTRLRAKIICSGAANIFLPHNMPTTFFIGHQSTLLHTSTTNSRHIPAEYCLPARCAHPRRNEHHSKFPFPVCGQEVAMAGNKYIDSTSRHSQREQESSSHIV